MHARTVERGIACTREITKRLRVHADSTRTRARTSEMYYTYIYVYTCTYVRTCRMYHVEDVGVHTFSGVPVEGSWDVVSIAHFQ